MKNFKISNLSEFMKILQEISSDNKRFYFRGESLKYKTPLVASGYRYSRFSSELSNMRKEFFREVGFALDVDSRENFMAYSQHHGLPTELLDVTENPIVALYFACEDNLENDGSLYAIENNSAIIDPLNDKVYDKEKDVESIQNQMWKASSFFQETGGKRILFENSSFYQEMRSHFSNVLLLEYVNKEIAHSKQYMNSKLTLCKYILEMHHKGSLPSIIQHPSNIIKNKDNITELINLLDKYSNHTELFELENFYSEFSKLEIVNEIEIQPNDDIDNPYKERNQNFCPNPLLLLFIIAYEIRSDVFPPFPKIIYKPSIIFDRLKNQQGLFIYQMSSHKYSPLPPSYREEKYVDAVKQVIQKIDYEYEIIVTNKKKILQELDFIGINRKFIYPDSDNIAQYIKNKNNM
ncbi:FRG domain-containing protein [Periweissella fabaria]|uniref:FRG domain-containing protein n=1 Tax=Periweissella fabaria TaxID=546157 RepID=A0ABM8Z3R2_9LACO|nr:FRG domain-containing protein [Periweissella fabaria]MCM0598028.1 FRG domain-containing protein [Periweissella fabaria]CAH0415909.1 hypothetical protein WFA24289_00207 [Periweissella fabaria]